jgi:alpha-acetolactate decarboxylase
MTVELDDSNEFFLVLPESEEFHRVNLSEQREAELQKVER